MNLLTDYIQPGRIFFRNKEYDPQTVMAGIDSVSRYLSENLISKSPFVYLFATNHVKTVFAYFGIIKARRICVIMDPKIGPLELEEKLLDTPPTACIRIDRATESFDFSKEIELRNPPWKDGPDDLSDVCTMIYTAAEDGYAKAVMLTHENMLSNARDIITVDSVSTHTISNALIHYNHLFALQVGVIAPFLASGNILIQEIFDLKNIQSLSKEMKDAGVTNFYSVPIVYFMLSKIKDINQNVKKINGFTSGGCKLSEEIYNRFKKNTGQDIHEGYGLTEASPICSWHRRNDKININSVGRAFPCCEIKLFDKNMPIDAINSLGEICIKGKNVMKGYYNNLQYSKKILIDNWLHSGDLGYKDEKGYLYLTGLKKRMINYAGNKIYSEEVERICKKNEFVLQINVWGEKNVLYGYQAHADVILNKNTLQTQNTFLNWCYKNITVYKIPTKINFS